jgi:hypothetical protein
MDRFHFGREKANFQKNAQYIYTFDQLNGGDLLLQIYGRAGNDSRTEGE